MAFILLIAFITIPIIEIAVFIEVGGRIGLWSTIAVVILTAVVGTALLRQQGLSVLFRIQENLEANRIPVQELFDGVCLVIAGALLLTPGFVTDAIGFALFVAPFRRWLAGQIGRRFLARADVHYTTHSYNDGSSSGPSGPVIDGEFSDITRNEDGDNQPPSKQIEESNNNENKDRT